MEGLLAPRGRAVFVDEGRHSAWNEEWVDEPRAVVRRTLRDGTVYRAVKMLWHARDLEEHLAKLGWSAAVTPEGPFYWGVAER